jgi:hypothetical protein
MQTVLFAIVLFGFSIGVVDYDDQKLVCVDNGQVGFCVDKTLETVSTYDCGPKGCSGF